MLFFQSIKNPFLDIIANIASFFAEETVLIFALVLIYWCIDKRKGFAIFLSLMISLNLMQGLKAIFKVERPYLAYGDLIEAERTSTATGYSFPSGHSTGASSFYSSLLLLFKNKAIRILAILIIILVPLSRLYLGVHWPLDVMFGTILGLGITLFFEPYFIRLYDEKKKLYKAAIPIGIALSIISLAMSVLLELDLVDAVAYSDFMKTLSVFSTALLCGVIEINTTDFVEAKTMKDKVITCIFGLAFIGLIQATKLIVPDSIYYIWSYVRYSLIGASATYFVPLILIKMNVLKKRSYYTGMFRDVI